MHVYKMNDIKVRVLPCARLVKMTDAGEGVMKSLMLADEEVCAGDVRVNSDELLFPRAEVCCMLCDARYPVGGASRQSHRDGGDRQLLTHLLIQHNLVIADVSHVASIPAYFAFWKKQFQGKNIEEYCSTLLLDKTPDGKYSKDEKYYLLSDVLPMDYELRKNLQTERLEKILAYNKLEREDANYKRECLFCRLTITGLRSDFLRHLETKHNFYIAKTDNLVFISELVEMLSNKLDTFVCIYCEKVFKDRVVLKEHMRKKSHKRINPENKAYDKYFISNYLEVGRNWQTYLKNINTKKKRKEPLANQKVNCQQSDSSDSDENWSDWEEKDSQIIICLFCKHGEAEYTNLLKHMISAHNFNFELITRDFDYYEKIKIVNYVRRQTHLMKCIKCDNKLPNLEKLLEHMQNTNHFDISQHKQLWNQPEFYFSTYEDDGLLCCLLDKDDYTEENDEYICQNIIKDLSEQIALSVIKDE